MTGPYQPPGGDINSPFGAPDPTSPFTPGPGSGDAEPKGERAEEESSSAGIQYELEAPGHPPMTPPPHSGPPAYGPAAPPPAAYAPMPTYAPMPPKKSGSNGLLIGGIVAGGFVLLLVFGVIIVVAAVGGGGGGRDGDDSTEQHKATYTIPGDPCADVDMSSIEAIGAFDTPPTGSASLSDSYGYGSCYGSFGSYGEGNYGYYSLSLNTYGSETGLETGWESAIGSNYMGGCDTSDVSGSWDKGQLGTGTSCASPISGNKVVLSIQADNLVATLTLDGEADVSSKGADALQSVAESLLTASKI